MSDSYDSDGSMTSVLGETQADDREGSSRGSQGSEESQESQGTQGTQKCISSSSQGSDVSHQLFLTDVYIEEYKKFREEMLQKIIDLPNVTAPLPEQPVVGPPLEDPSLEDPSLEDPPLLIVGSLPKCNPQEHEMACVPDVKCPSIGNSTQEMLDLFKSPEEMRELKKNKEYILSQVSQCITDQGTTSNCFAHVVAHAFEKFFHMYYDDAYRKRPSAVPTKTFLQLMSKTNYWIFERPQLPVDTDEFFADGGENETLAFESGEKLVVDLLVGACGGNMYDYLSLSSFMFFYCLLRRSLTPNQYILNDGGYLYPAFTYVIQTLEKYRKMFHEGRPDEFIINQMICDTRVARAECDALLNVFKNYFESNDIIAVVGSDRHAVIDMQNPKMSIHKTLKLIINTLQQNKYIGISVDANKLTQPEPEPDLNHESQSSSQSSSRSLTQSLTQLVSQPESKPTSIEAHAITAVKYFFDYDEIIKESVRLDETVENDDPLKAIKIIEELTNKKGFTTKNSWGADEIDTGIYDFTFSEIERHCNLLGEMLFSACGVIDLQSENFPLYSWVLFEQDIELDIKNIYQKERIEHYQQIVQLAEQNTSGVNPELSSSNMQQKITMCEHLYEKIESMEHHKIYDFSQVKQVLMQAKKVLKTEIGKISGSQEASSGDKFQKIEKAQSEKVQGDLGELEMTKDYLFNMKKDIRFAIKYAINTGNVEKFQKLLNCFGPLHDVGDDYDYDQDVQGESIFGYICKGYDTMIDCKTYSVSMLKELFEYCYREGYMINFFYKKSRLTTVINNIMMILMKTT